MNLAFLSRSALWLVVVGAFGCSQPSSPPPARPQATPTRLVEEAPTPTQEKKEQEEKPLDVASLPSLSETAPKSKAQMEIEEKLCTKKCNGVDKHCYDACRGPLRKLKEEELWSKVDADKCRKAQTLMDCAGLIDYITFFGDRRNKPDQYWGTHLKEVVELFKELKPTIDRLTEEAKKLSESKQKKDIEELYASLGDIKNWRKQSSKSIVEGCKTLALLQKYPYDKGKYSKSTLTNNFCADLMTGLVGMVMGAKPQTNPAMFKLAVYILAESLTDGEVLIHPEIFTTLEGANQFNQHVKLAQCVDECLLKNARATKDHCEAKCRSQL